MTLRPFNINDAETILSWCKDKHAFRLWSADRYKEFPAQPEEMEKQYEGDKMYPLTAVVGNAIVGHILLRHPSEDKSVIRFGFVIVDDSKRGMGYGKRMLRLAIDYAQRELSAQKITLGVFCDNLSAVECYKSVGFRITGTDSYLIDGEEWKEYEMEMYLVKFPKYVIRHKLLLNIPNVWGNLQLSVILQRQKRQMSQRIVLNDE